MRLDSAAINAVRDRIDAELATRTRDVGPEAACREVLRKVKTRGLEASETEVVEIFFHVVWLFNHCPSPDLISKKTVDELTRMVEYSLRLLGIKPYVSHLSYLFRILYEARAKQLDGKDDAWLAAWSFNLADAMDGGLGLVEAESVNFDKQLHLAECHFKLGFIGESLEAYRTAEELAGSEERIVQSRIGMMRCLRLLDEVETAMTLAMGLDHFEASPSLLLEVEWERRLLEAQYDDDVAPLVDAIKAIQKSPTEAKPRHLLLGILWCYASKRRALIGELPKAAWIKRAFASDAFDPRTREMLKLVQALERCHSTHTTIFDKLRDLGPFLAQIRTERPTEENVIFLAAVVRWLIRVKQKNSAVLVMNDYQRCSHRLSQGRSSALFGLLLDLGDKLNASGETTRAKGDVRSLKSGMERSFLFLEMFSKLFLTAVAAKAGSIVGGKSPRDLQNELMIKLSQYFVQYAAGAMKGPIHKFAQIMLNVFSLPPEAEENFKSVLWSRQLVAEKTMRKVFEDDLGRKIDDVFSEFDFTPIGIGSVSQVYRARLKSGEEVAVKIQYPDLDKITKQDIAMFFRIFTAARWLLPSVDVAAVKRHVQNLVEREIDFRDEARISLDLQKIAAGGARWSVPMVYQNLSTRRVLTTEYIRGQNIYQFSETSTEAERLSAAQAVSEFAIRSVLDAGLVCIDPHPANMIFSKGKVYLIDFGFFMKVSPDFVTLHREILLSHTSTGDARVDRYQAVLHRAGLLRSSPQIADSDVRDFLNVMSRQFNWQTCADPNLQDRFNELFFKKGINKIFGADDPEFFLSYLGQRQVYKTISRFNVPQPHEWTFTLAGELGLEIAGARAG